MRWEYKVIWLGAEHLKGDAPDFDKLEMDLNELGAAEWELVALLPLANRSRGIRAVFKRSREGSMW